MRYCPRKIESSLGQAARAFPAVVLTGPRRAGKTLVLKKLFPEARYFLLEDPDVVARLRADPQGFLDAIDGPVILDEIQNVPEVLAYVRTRIDARPRRTGRFFLTGSQEAPLMQGVSESMAGRAAVLQLLPLSSAESDRVSPLRGGFPEALARPKAARLWFASYLQTYLERDVRTVTAVRDLATFRRFMAIVASRHAQVLNRSDLAAPLGVSVPTVTQWLNILETSGQILLIPPYFENLGKRLIKSPRLYIADSGLACHLLGIESQEELARSPFRGAIFEGFVASELAKARLNAGERRELYYFRDAQGLEVDFLMPGRGGHLTLIECKSGATVTPDMARPMLRLAEAFHARRPRGVKVEALVIHESTKSQAGTSVVAPGVQALDWRALTARVTKRLSGGVGY